MCLAQYYSRYCFLVGGKGMGIGDVEPLQNGGVCPYCGYDVRLRYVSAWHEGKLHLACCFRVLTNRGIDSKNIELVKKK